MMGQANRTRERARKPVVLTDSYCVGNPGVYWSPLKS